MCIVFGLVGLFFLLVVVVKLFLELVRGIIIYVLMVGVFVFMLRLKVFFIVLFLVVFILLFLVVGCVDWVFSWLLRVVICLNNYFENLGIFWFLGFKFSRLLEILLVILVFDLLLVSMRMKYLVMEVFLLLGLVYLSLVIFVWMVMLRVFVKGVLIVILIDMVVWCCC